MPSQLSSLPPRMIIPGGEIITICASPFDPAAEHTVWVRCTNHTFTKRPAAKPVPVTCFDNFTDIKVKAIEILADCEECAFEREQLGTTKRTTLWGEGAEW